MNPIHWIILAIIAGFTLVGIADAIAGAIKSKHTCHKCGAEIKVD